VLRCVRGTRAELSPLVIARSSGDYAPNSIDVVDLDAAESAAPAVDPVLAQAGFTTVNRSSEARTIKTHGPAF
jgi:hypothetical protein